MKEYCGMAFNPTLLEKANGDFLGSAEMVFIYSEPRFALGVDGLSRSRDTGEFRIAFSSNGLRELSKHCLEYADELDALEERANARPVQP